MMIDENKRLHLEALAAQFDAMFRFREDLVALQFDLQLEGCHNMSVWIPVSDDLLASNDGGLEKYAAAELPAKIIFVMRHTIQNLIREPVRFREKIAKAA